MIRMYVACCSKLSMSRMILPTISLVIVKIVSGCTEVDISACPTWYVSEPNNSSVSSDCVCKDIEGLVTCLPDLQQVRLKKGMCMTYDHISQTLEVGKCPYSMFDASYAQLQRDGYIYVPMNVSELNEFMCESWGREGHLCSDCQEGYGLTIANVYINCVKCTLPRNLAWLFYFVLELVPLTVLFFMVSVFRISVAKPPMNAFVVFCQLALALLFTQSYRFYPPYVVDAYWLKGLHRFYLIILGVWGMTLTRFIESITNFCVDPSINIQQAFTLTQIQSAFPLLLIALTSIGIELHARNCRLIVWLWKPFHKYFVCCSRLWNSKLSLIDVFSTYLLLSYSRFFNVLYFIFSFQHAHSLSAGQCYATRLLYNPSVSYFDTLHHLPYALVLLLIFFVIVLPPVLLLALYQFPVVKKVLQCTGLYRSRIVRTFVDLFHGCYKDGTDGTRDLRFTAGLYLLVRVAVLLSLVLCHFTDHTQCETVSVFLLVFLLLLFVGLARPYKDQRMNILDSLLLSILAVVCVLLTVLYPTVRNQLINTFIVILIFIVIGAPHAVLFTYVLYKICRYLHKTCVLILKARFMPKPPVNIELLGSVAERSDDSYKLM